MHANTINNKVPLPAHRNSLSSYEPKSERLSILQHRSTENSFPNETIGFIYVNRPLSKGEQKQRIPTTTEDLQRGTY